MLWFDAHLDLAYLAVSGRDLRSELNPEAGPHPPAAVTLPSLAAGGVRMAMATIFTEPDGTGPEGYAPGDAERAARVGRAQLEVYLDWRERGLVMIDLPGALRVAPGTGQMRGGMGVAELVPPPVAQRLAAAERVSGARGRNPLHIGILIENADPIRSPDELGWWKERGVIAIGLAWAKSSRYAGGNSTQEGVSGQGRELVAEMDRLGIVHDFSHLSDRAFGDLCAATDKRIVASHSNCRSLLGNPENQRHLTDEQIREIRRRGGIIGLNLYSRFLNAMLAESGRASLADAVAHIDRVCDLCGDRLHVGLGSDMDGGFSAARLPRGIDRPADLALLAEALRERGWSETEVDDFAFGNWARFWAGR